MSYNAKVDRTWRINGSVSIAGMTAQFVQGMSITMDANLFQRNYIGTGESVFTQNGDVVGSFSFSLKNTTTLYSEAVTPTEKQTISYWMKNIADIEPKEIIFIELFNAPKGTGKKNARIKFTGRVMKPTVVMDVGDGLQDVNVEGEITTFTSALRETS